MKLAHEKLAELSLNNHCALLTALRRSLSYLHYHFLRSAEVPSSRAYWLTEIREAYALYRRIDFGFVVRPEDRYSNIVKFVSQQHLY